MKNKKLTIGGAGLIALLLTAGLATSSFAYQGNPNTEGPNYSPQRHEVMTQAFEAESYNAWKELMPDKSRSLEVVNEDNFSEFVKAHKLAQEGDILAANEIRASLGLGGKGMRNRDTQDRGQRAQRHKEKGRNAGGHFVDDNGDGICDKLQ